MTQREFAEFNSEMARLKNITYQGYAKTLKEVGVSYIGNVNCSAKLHHNETINMHTYGIYLASADASGYNVCPKSENCRESCLYGSGHNKIDRLAGKTLVDDARILKTRLFFANKEVFMLLVIHEIERAKKNAERKGFQFSVRLNCTSDINVTAFNYKGKCLLDVFPDVQFYDYTKVPAYLANADKFKNFNITFSYDGSNENFMVCQNWLNKGGHVAVVFGVTKESELPKTWLGYKVLCGDKWDYRPWDYVMFPDCQIVGLIYKVSSNDFDENHNFMGIPESDFIVSKRSKDCEW